MGELVDASLAFPSVVLTVLVGIAVLYWIFVILGALDIDLFHADADVDGALDGAGGHGADLGGHGVDAGGHDIGGHDAGGHDAGGHDAGDGGDAGGHDAGGDGIAYTLLGPLKLRRVPITISCTFVFVISWALCLLVMHYVGPYSPDWLPSWLFGACVLVSALILSLPITAVGITPLAPAFATAAAGRRRDNVGSTCTVTTGHVDESFGQAKITEGGKELVIPVRCDRKDVKLTRHDQAMVIDYDDERDAYIVEPLADLLPGRKED